MRKYLEGALIALGLSGSAHAADKPSKPDTEVRAPQTFTRESLNSAVLPSDFDWIAREQRQETAREILNILHTMVPSMGASENASAVAALDKAANQKSTFEAGRLTSNILRNELLRITPLLNAEQLRELERVQARLSAVGVGIPSFAELSAYAEQNKSTRAGQEQLYRTYHDLITTLRPPVAEPLPGQDADAKKTTAPPPRPIQTTSLPPRATTTPSRETPSVSIMGDEAAGTPITSPEKTIETTGSTAPAARETTGPTIERIGAKGKKDIRPAVPGPLYGGSLIKEIRVKTESGEEERHPVFILTFDDGPHPKQTPQILNILKQKNVHATFFLVGSEIRKYAKTGILQRMVAEGHQVGLHANEHEDLQKKYTAAEAAQMYQNEVADLNALLARYGIAPSKIFRPPGGSISKTQRDVLAEHGVYAVNWNCDPEDFDRPGVDTIVQRTTTKHKLCLDDKGLIVLMHDSGGDRKQTIAALPQIIDIYRSRNGIFGTVDQALGLQPFDIEKQNMHEESITNNPGHAQAVDAAPPTPTPNNVKPTSLQTRPTGIYRYQNGKVELIDGATESTDIMGNHRQAHEAVESPKPSHETKENHELPPGAFGLDAYGIPFGWRFTYQYIQSPNDYPKPEELSPPFRLRNRQNNADGTPRIEKIPGLLRTEAFNAVTELRDVYIKAAKHNEKLREMGFWLTEAARDAERQVYLRKRYHGIAAHVDESEHQIGTAIDVLYGKYQEMYYFLMGNPEDWNNKKFVPRMVQKGFVPTYANEPWHYRYVGPEHALEFWKKNRAIIIREHSRLLNAWPPPEFKLAPDVAMGDISVF